MDEGVVKYYCEWFKAPPLDQTLLKPLVKWRQWCFESGLIGQYPNGIGYGNISMRRGDGFIISGTQTGGIAELEADRYCEVIETDIEKNRLTCQGPIAASSEGLTHAMFYRLDPDIGGVIHVHHRAKWESLLNRIPTSVPNIPYGTPEMAREIERLWNKTNLPKERIVAMEGHEEGIIAFGNDLDEAGRVLDEWRSATVDDGK
ncbi:MAG: class II aldolase/adducin family protein [Chlorobi bacterium]|nr:class II aldolase/adducin family protein [Chlorobiota bacterium]